jgi:hypothetical protein
LKVFPPILIIPERGPLVVLDLTAKLKGPPPTPLVVDSVIQLTLVAAIQPQSPAVVLRSITPSAPSIGKNSVVGEIEKEQAGGAGEKASRATVPDWPTT